MSCLYDLPNYEKEENILTLNKLETTVAIIKMRKTDRIVPRHKAMFPCNEFYAREKFPAETLIANDDKSYNLICNGAVVNTEPFPNNFPVRKAKNSESMVKILTTIFAANIDLKSDCFQCSMSNAYTALLPLQVDYYFDKETITCSMENALLHSNFWKKSTMSILDAATYQER